MGQRVSKCDSDSVRQIRRQISGQVRQDVSKAHDETASE